MNLLYSGPVRIGKYTHMYHVEFLPGVRFHWAVDKAISMAKELDATIVYQFNGVEVRVRRDSSAKRIYSEWYRSLGRLTWRRVAGPYPLPITAAKRRRDEKISPGSTARREKFVAWSYDQYARQA